MKHYFDNFFRFVIKHRTVPCKGCKRARFFLSVCSLLVILLTLPLVPASLLLSCKDEVLFEKIVGPLEWEVTFRHSYNKGLIRELYKIDLERGQMTLYRGYNESFGAGMIDTVETTHDLNFRREGKWYVMDFPPSWQLSVHYIGGRIADHKLVYGDSVVPFGRLHTGRPLVIEIQCRSLLQKMFHFK